MLTIFEGPRNSGKTFLVNEYSKMTGIPVFKYDFSEWFVGLNLSDSSNETHLFALGKESMLHQLNRDGFLEKDFIVDRGMVTVLVWGILSKRITEEDAKYQLELIAKMGLFKDCRIVHINGENPNISKREKDFWDFRDTESIEADLMENFRDILCNQPYNIETHFITNTFDNRVLESLKAII